MDGYGLTREEYMELKWFCLQYADKKQRLAMLLNGGDVNLDGMPHGTEPGNPTLSAVIRREPLVRDCQIPNTSAGFAGIPWVPVGAFQTVFKPASGQPSKSQKGDQLVRRFIPTVSL